MWIAIIGALIPAIIALIQWLSNRKKPLTPHQLKQLNHVLAKCHELKTVAGQAGAKPDGEIDPDEE